MVKTIAKRAYVRVELVTSLRAIARRYSEGESLASIAADYGTNVGTIRNIARRAGCPVRPVGRPRRASCAG